MMLLMEMLYSIIAYNISIRLCTQCGNVQCIPPVCVYVCIVCMCVCMCVHVGMCSWCFHGYDAII